VADTPRSRPFGAWLDPAGRRHRFTVLLVVALVPLGVTFAFDIFGAIAPTLVDAFGAARSTVASFYTIYSGAAILSLLVAGLAIDRLGPRRAGLLFLGLVVAGASLAAAAPSLALMAAGRFLFGCGAESVHVVTLTVCARWFRGRELALAMGIAIALGRLGSILSFNSGELLAAELGGHRPALAVAAGLCVLSLALFMLFCALDRRAERLGALDAARGGERIAWRELNAMPRLFWLLTFLCVAFYSAVFPFTALSTDFFADKWGIPRVAAAGGGFAAGFGANLVHLFGTAGGLTSLLTLSSMVFAAWVGAAVDRYGGRATLLMAGPLLQVPAFLLLGLTDMHPAGPMLMMAAAFVLLPAALWPAFALAVDKARTGTAYGLAMMVQNVGLALFPLLNGWLRDATHSYQASMLMFAALGATAFALAVRVWREDKRIGGKLQKVSRRQ
jgi:MFS family permease